MTHNEKKKHTETKKNILLGPYSLIMQIVAFFGFGFVFG